jgi:hypothetical protein
MQLRLLVLLLLELVLLLMLPLRLLVCYLSSSSQIPLLMLLLSLPRHLLLLNQRRIHVQRIAHDLPQTQLMLLLLLVCHVATHPTDQRAASTAAAHAPK